MRVRSLGWIRVSVVAIAFMSSTIAGAAEQERSGERENGSTSTAASATTGKQPGLVRIPHPVARRATLSALHSAVARFEKASCRRILLEFADRDGRPLEDRLTSLQVDIGQYVSTLVFYDGSRSAPCDKGALTFTAPGSRVIHVCIDQSSPFNRASRAST